MPCALAFPIRSPPGVDAFRKPPGASGLAWVGETAWGGALSLCHLPSLAAVWGGACVFAEVQGLLLI